MFQERIQSHYETLSPRFRALPDFILENTLDVGFMTTTALARRVSVDPATVVRFSQKIGYSGYRELSREIKDYINNQLALRYGRKEPDVEGIPGEVVQLLDELSNRLLDMKVDAERIADIIRAIRGARRIVTVGAVAGLGLAELWAAHLRLIGCPAISIPADPAQAALVLRDLGAEDLVVAIALGLASGTEIGPILGLAADIGIQTVSITASPTLLPARQADVNLVVPAKTPSGYPSFDTIAAVLSIVWQTLIMEDEVGAARNVGDAIDTLVKLAVQAGRYPGYDRAALMRLWEQE
ncbi:MAG: MurR/RpiR family transcriptional regulator [Anaerolineae bacterium]